jgi:hypothetical protein
MNLAADPKIQGTTHAIRLLVRNDRTMCNTIRSTSTLISILLLAVLFTACTSGQPDNQPLAANVNFGAMDELDRAEFGDCSTEKYERTIDQTLIEPLDPETATLKQILGLSWLANDDVTTYKSCQLRVHRISDDEAELRWVKFVEFGSEGRYGFRTAHLEDVFSEYRSVGSQRFKRSSRHDWEEAVPSPGGPTPNLASELFRSFLDENGVELLSSNEVTDAGVAVYRLGDKKLFTILENSIDVGTQIRSTTVLVDQKTFRIVTGIIEQDYETPLEGHTPGTTTEHFYDYNEPVVIEIPDNYVPWSEPVASNVIR